MITNCKFTCITVKVELFNKTEIFTTYILWPIPKLLIDVFAVYNAHFLEFKKELISYFSVTSG